MSRNPAYNAFLNKVNETIVNEAENNFFGKVPKQNVIQDGTAITKAMLITYEAKDTDYASNGKPMGNLRLSEKMGIAPWKAVLLRMSDKLSRIESFIQRGEYSVEDEKVTDTLIDFANYALLGRCLFDEYFEDQKTNNVLDAQTNWLSLSYLCVKSKLLYEYNKNEEYETIKWSQNNWEQVKYYFELLCEFARSV